MGIKCSHVYYKNINSRKNSVRLKLRQIQREMKECIHRAKVTVTNSTIKERLDINIASAER